MPLLPKIDQLLATNLACCPTSCPTWNSTDSSCQEKYMNVISKLIVLIFPNSLKTSKFILSCTFHTSFSKVHPLTFFKLINSMASSRVFPKDAKLKAASPVSNSGKSGGLNCPVCDKPLGEPNYCYSLGVNGYYSLMNQNYKMLVKEKDTEARRKRIEEEWEGRKQRKQDTEVVVAATCGELFHKACLRRFCSSTFR
jgi:hypothetical protein